MIYDENRLIGIFSAAFANSSKLRILMIFAQFLYALLSLASIFVDNQNCLFFLLIISVATISGWCYLNIKCLSVRSYANYVRRLTLLLSGLGRKPSAQDIDLIMSKKFHLKEASEGFENPSYFWSKEPVGPSRLLELIEESAFYSRKLQRESAGQLLQYMSIFFIVAIVSVLVSTDALGRDLQIYVAKSLLTFGLFFLTADVLGAFLAHRECGNQISEILAGINVIHASGEYEQFDITSIFCNYNSAIEGAPEILPRIFPKLRASIEQDWNSYVQHRPSPTRSDAV